MRIDVKAAHVAVLGALCLTLGACASTMPPPDRPGQFGQIERGGKKVAGVMVAVHAPAAAACTYGGAEAFRKRDGGFHDFLFVPGIYSSPQEVPIDCRTSEGEELDRTIKPPFNDEAFRLHRTASTVGAILGGGPLGLISGPLAAEMSRKTFFQPPILIHVPAKADLTSEEARVASREAAVGRWSEIGAMLDKECDPKRRTSKQVVMGYACAKGWFAVLRDTDLAIFNAIASKAAVEAPISAEGVAATAAEPAPAGAVEETPAATPEPAAMPAA